MKIAIINEVSACGRNEDIVCAVRSACDAELLNLGMKAPEEEPQLTYIHTSYMSAMLLNTKACDFVVGGCGTGQGYLNAVLQFPNVVCGLIADPLDAWLFSQINGGNCISLPLNKGYGWAADINLKYVFEKLFCDPAGRGYPEARAESQANSRKILGKISRIAHHDMAAILRNTDEEILRTIAKQTVFMDVMDNANEESRAMAAILRGAQ